VRPLSDKFNVGISLHNYFGLALDWDDSWVGRYSSVNVTLLGATGSAHRGLQGV